MNILKEIENAAFAINGVFSRDIFIYKCRDLFFSRYITLKNAIFAYLYFITEDSEKSLVDLLKNIKDDISDHEHFLKFEIFGSGHNHRQELFKSFSINNIIFWKITDDGRTACIEMFNNLYLKDEANINVYIDTKNDNKINKIFYGPPGTGKTRQFEKIKEMVKPENFVFITFHQSYSYEDFIEGIRPVMQDYRNGPVDMPPSKDVCDIAYSIKPGAFKALCDKARKSTDENERFVIFIDEINRGNISKVFGELITFIEGSYRTPVDYEWNKWNVSEDKMMNVEPARNPKPFEGTLLYSGENFSVPENVEIYGAMNTADRSLTLIDTALRRRFEFVPMWPDANVLQENLGEYKTVQGIDILAMFVTMNERIEALYDRDHTIGHAFFLPLRNATDEQNAFEMLQNIFRRKIIPLLEEYFFDDWEKIRLVLGNQFVTVKALEEDNKKLFPNLKEESIPASLRHDRYEIDDSAYSKPEAYRAIYA